MGNQAVREASLARSSQDLKQSTIMMNHPGGFQARAKHCVCAHSSCIAPVSLQNLLKNTWKNKILTKHNACAGNNYEAIQSPQKNLQNHVRLHLYKQHSGTIPNPSPSKIPESSRCSLSSCCFQSLALKWYR